MVNNQSNGMDLNLYQKLQNLEYSKCHRQRKEYKRKHFYCIRKATATLNRPQTSEGTRRKRFMNSGKNDSKQVFETKKSEFELLDYNPNVIQEDDSENQEIIPISLNQLNSPKELLSIRSGQRRKQTEQGLIENYDQNERPPSRHKTPPKATGLELPIQSGNQITNRDGVDIPIKNMYAQIDKLENLKYNTNDLKNNDDFDDFDLGFFKMNNKMDIKLTEEVQQKCEILCIDIGISSILSQKFFVAISNSLVT